MKQLMERAARDGKPTSVFLVLRSRDFTVPITRKKKQLKVLDAALKTKTADVELRQRAELLRELVDELQAFRSALLEISKRWESALCLRYLIERGMIQSEPLKESCAINGCHCNVTVINPPLPVVKSVELQHYIDALVAARNSFPPERVEICRAMLYPDVFLQRQAAYCADIGAWRWRPDIAPGLEHAKAIFDTASEAASPLPPTKHRDASQVAASSSQRRLASLQRRRDNYDDDDDDKMALDDDDDSDDNNDNDDDDDDIVEEDDDSDGTVLICICRRPTAGVMTRCDEEKCTIGWWHNECVMERRCPLPVGKNRWLCPCCATPVVSSSARVLRPSQRMRD